METHTLIETIQQELLTFGLPANQVVPSFKEDILVLEGKVNSNQEMVDLCHKLAKVPGVANVVSHITTPETVVRPEIDKTPYLSKGVYETADVVIVGGGVTGCAIARTLSQYQLKIIVVEKASDLCEGTTKANNGMIHSGYDSKPSSLKAKLCVKGNAMYTQWAEELGFAFNRTGSFVCGFDQADKEVIDGLLVNGQTNGVPDIEVITGDQARAIEPGLSDAITSALWTPSAGFVEPYEVALALMENAIDNGAKLLLDTEVFDVLQEEGKVTGVLTNRGILQAKVVVNGAGLYADELSNMAGDECYTIHPRRGTLVIMDKENAGKLHTFAGKAPSNYTKGGGPEETPEGTLLWGPSAKEVADKEDLGVDQDDLDFILEKGLELTKGISPDSLITYFSGNRAATFTEDFVIKASTICKNFVHVGGIQSPGLAASPAIAEMATELILGCLPNTPVNPSYNPKRTEHKHFRFCSAEERKALIAENPAYGRVICRCETVTEAEILAAIHGKVPARTVDAIKRRTRAGMGRCQSGFCGSRVVEILARELGVSPLDITLKGEGSQILQAPTRTKGGDV